MSSVVQASVSAEKQSLALRREIAFIKASQGVKDGFIEVTIEPATGNVLVAFVLRTDTLVVKNDIDIRPEEPIMLFYKSMESIGSAAPTLVLSGRPDFPRNFGHLNAVRPGTPVSICLTRTGLQPIYDRFGIEGVLTRLRSWIRDAQTGALMADGWEPVPYSKDMRQYCGLLDAAAFQNVVNDRKAEAGWLAGLATVTPAIPYFWIHTDPLSAEQPAHNSELSKKVRAQVMPDHQPPQRNGIPWVFVWPSGQQITTDPFFGLWKTFKDMREGLKEAKLDQLLLNAVGSVLGNGCDCLQGGLKRFVVLVGVWRPVPLHENIFGLSENREARRLEIKAFVLETDIGPKSVIADDARVHAIVADPLPGPELYRWTSGISVTNAAAIIGYGALGSEIGEHLLRLGIPAVKAFDEDRLAPHNFARHRERARAVYDLKVSTLARAADAMGVQHKTEVATEHEVNLIDLDDAAIANQLGPSKLIIDATAEERMRIRLSQFNKADRRQVVRVEIYHRGKLGVQFVTSTSGKLTLVDLYFAFCLQALHDDAVAAWIADEHINGLSKDELIFGMGCASRTTKLPGFVVAQHASAFMPTIIEGLDAGAPTGIGLNLLDENWRPTGWRWTAVPEFMSYAPKNTDWTVHVHPQVLDFLAAQRATAAPRETGGYLYGGFDIAAKHMTIVQASAIPPNSAATEASLKLGPAGATDIERQLTRRTHGRIRLCGTWHSHPGGSAAMSGKDRSTFGGFASVDLLTATPTLMIIAADGNAEVHLRV